MRPIRLQLGGFSAFRETAEISFEGTDLVAFVGPTGSGKSSLIDAMTFALYGSVARYGDLRLVEPVIHQLATEARVRLDFELGGQRYTAVRVVTRTKTGATTKEARLVRVDADGAEQILAGQPREMPAAVATLFLGLDFEQFTRTVVLPQGEFAVFLHADKSTRQKLLRQLLDVGVYEAMGKLARTRATTAQGRLGVLVEQRDAKGEVTPAQLAEHKARIKSLAALTKSVATQLDEVAELDARIAEGGARVTELRQTAQALGKIAVPAAVTKLAPLLASAESDLAVASAALKAARTARDAAQAGVAASPDVVVLEQSLAALDAVARLTGEIEVLAPASSAATEVASAAAEAAAATERVLEQADVAHRAATDAAGLGAAIAALAVGEPCPVCTQTVNDLPGHDVDAELARAKSALDAARTANNKATKAANDAATERATLGARLESFRSELTQVSGRLPAGADEETLQGELANARALKLAFDDALQTVATAEAAEEAAQAAVERHRKTEGDLRQSLTRARDSVGARQPPSPVGHSLPEDWSALATWAGVQKAEVGQEVVEAAAEVAEWTRCQRQATSDIEAACAEVGVVGPVARVKERLATEAANAQNAFNAALALQEELAGLATEISELTETESVNREMGQLLSVGGFERWLVQSALNDLLARATDRLFELSSGQFSLESEDGEFSIRDHRNADEVRNVRTLSGGETFLASLALALALAESIAELAVQGGPRIESMFLDEGFGTLDDDARDMVATTLEELSAGGRLIGIVTHIRDLADRMPVRFEVHKDATTARVERVEA